MAIKAKEGNKALVNSEGNAGRQVLGSGCDFKRNHKEQLDEVTCSPSSSCFKIRSSLPMKPEEKSTRELTGKHFLKQR